MGYVRVRARLWNVEAGGAVKEVELLADTGAIYSALPRSVLEELGIKPMGRRRFRLANNQVLERDVGIVGIEVEGLKTHTIAIFGDEGVFLLGVVTLEELGLQVDPVQGELKPLELLLMSLLG